MTGVAPNAAPTVGHAAARAVERVVVTDDGASLAVAVAGPIGGPVAVLPHCWTGGRAVWAPVADRLVGLGWRVVLYDQRGHGASTVGVDGCTIERLGTDLRAVLDAVDVHDAVLAGHSMGGMTIQAFAAGHGPVADARVRAVVLVATSSGRLSRGRVGDALLVRAVGSPLVERAMRRGRGQLLVRGVFGRPAVRADVCLTRDLFVACPAPVRVEFLRAMQGMDVRAGLRRIGVPVTVLVGAADRLTPRRHAAAMAATARHATLTVFPRRGHMLPLEAPDEVTAAIVDAGPIG